jgi:glycerol-3-phosphate acyltransferase PlsX
VGYIEGRDISKDKVDVIVCDGFLGNIMLKAMEGTAELVLDSIKHQVDTSIIAKLGMWLAKPSLKKVFRTKLDPSAYGGAPLLGLNDIAIVCHGASNSRAIMNALRVARKFVDDALVVKMRGALTALDVKMPGEFQDGIWDRMGQRFDKKRKMGAEKKKSGDSAVSDE